MMALKNVYACQEKSTPFLIWKGQIYSNVFFTHFSISEAYINNDVRVYYVLITGKASKNYSFGLCLLA